MKLTLLGTGAAGGIPLFGCHCALCTAAREDNQLQRQPASALIEVNNQTILIDAGLMQLAEQFSAQSLDAILLTHFHPDHVQGLFHIRWGRDVSIPVYCPPDKEGCADLLKHPGILNFTTVRKYQQWQEGDLYITPLPLIHSKLTYGYLINYQKVYCAYLTDTKGLPEKVIHLLSTIPLDYLIIDTSSGPNVDNSNHNNLTDTLDLHALIKPKHTVLTHISHDFDVWLQQHAQTLPEGVIVGYDGLTLEFN